MSEEIENKVESMMRAEVHAGGVIEPGGIAIVADGADSPEIIDFPNQATVMPNTLPDSGVKINYTINGWPANLTAPTNLTMPNPAGTNMYVGDVPWQYWPPAVPSQYVPPVTITPTIGASTDEITPERIDELMSKQHIRVAPAPAPEITEERLREIVAETIKKVLYPEGDGLVTHQHRRVRQWDENGDEWRGVLYRVEKEEE